MKPDHPYRLTTYDNEGVSTRTFMTANAAINAFRAVRVLPQVVQIILAVYREDDNAWEIIAAKTKEEDNEHETARSR